MAADLKVDLCVIGAGSAGLSVASAAAQFGASTVLIERGNMGGECLNTGCVPSKALLAAAKAAHAVRTTGCFGVDAAPPTVDFGRVHRHVRDVIAAIAPHDSVERFENLVVQVIRAEARFVGPREIRYYEDIGLIRPPERRENRYRTYGETDVQTLRFIYRARNLGFSLKDISALLTLYQDRERASREVKHLALEHVSELDRKIAELTAIRNAIADLAERCHGDDRPDCPILDELGATAH